MQFPMKALFLVFAHAYLLLAFSHGRQRKLKKDRKEGEKEGREGERQRGREIDRDRGGFSFVSFYETLSQCPYPHDILNFQGQHLRTP